MQIVVQSKHIVAGRVHFKVIAGLPVNETIYIAIPFNPMLMGVAISLTAIEKNWMMF